MATTLRVYCPDEATQSEVVAWLNEFWFEEIQSMSTWEPDPPDGGSYGIFVDGADDDLKDDLEEVFEGRVEAEWEE